MQNAKPNEPNKDELKKDEIFIGEDLGITVIEVAESDKEKKTSSEGLIVDLTKLSSQSIDFLKQMQKKMKEEQFKRRKGFFRAIDEDGMLTNFLKKEKNIVLVTSCTAVVLSVIALINSTNGASKAFETSNEVLSVTKIGESAGLSEENVETIVKATSIEVLKKLDADKEKTQQDLRAYIDEQIKKFSTSVNADVQVQNSQDGLVFTTKDQFADAVEEALSYLRAREQINIVNSINESYSNAQNTVPDNRKIYGNPKARFVIQEFSDLECPYCNDFFNTPKAVADASNGLVAVEWIHTPLSFHEPAATQEAIAAECIYDQLGNRSFWTALQYIFNTTYGNGKGSPNMGVIPDAFGLDSGAYLKCINSPLVANRIEQSKQMAAQNGISSTPSSVIVDTRNGNRVVIGGAQDKMALMDAIERMNEQAEANEVDTDTNGLHIKSDM